jgi:hypothetical protein
VFHETLMRTYEGPGDCPELCGLRTADEVVAGYRAQGQFDPGNWWLAGAGGAPVGVGVQADGRGPLLAHRVLLFLPASKSGLSPSPLDIPPSTSP